MVSPNLGAWMFFKNQANGTIVSEQQAQDTRLQPPDPGLTGAGDSEGVPVFTGESPRHAGLWGPHHQAGFGFRTSGAQGGLRGKVSSGRPPGFFS